MTDEKLFENQGAYRIDLWIRKGQGALQREEEEKGNFVARKSLQLPNFWHILCLERTFGILANSETRSRGHRTRNDDRFWNYAPFPEGLLGLFRILSRPKSSRLSRSTIGHYNACPSCPLPGTRSPLCRSIKHLPIQSFRKSLCPLMRIAAIKMAVLPGWNINWPNFRSP